MAFVTFRTIYHNTCINSRGVASFVHTIGYDLCHPGRFDRPADSCAGKLAVPPPPPCQQTSSAAPPHHPYTGLAGVGISNSGRCGLRHPTWPLLLVWVPRLVLAPQAWRRLLASWAQELRPFSGSGAGGFFCRGASAPVLERRVTGLVPWALLRVLAGALGGPGRGFWFTTTCSVLFQGFTLCYKHVCASSPQPCPATPMTASIIALRCFFF